MVTSKRTFITVDKLSHFDIMKVSGAMLPADRLDALLEKCRQRIGLVIGDIF